MPVYFSGLMLGLSLIMALGPQNLFLIRQGAMRKHAALSAITCFFCDVILITGSVVGLQEVLQSHPSLKLWMAWFGATFLVYYGIKSLKQALKKSATTDETKQNEVTRRQIITLALGFSLLNPHAIIDSLVLIGGGSAQYPGQHQLFLFGVLTSSLIWFASLTLTAYYFSHVLTRVTVWKRVELFGGLLMLYLSIKLVCGQM